MALLGGAGRLWGPLVGVIPFTIIWEVVSSKFPNQTTLFLGLAFLLIVYVLPHGVVGRLEQTARPNQRRGQSVRHCALCPVGQRRDQTLRRSGRRQRR